MKPSDLLSAALRRLIEIKNCTCIASASLESFRGSPGMYMFLPQIDANDLPFLAPSRVELHHIFSAYLVEP